MKIINSRVVIQHRPCHKKQAFDRAHHAELLTLGACESTLPHVATSKLDPLRVGQDVFPITGEDSKY